MSETIDQVGGGDPAQASPDGGEEKSWLMETAYVRCIVLPPDHAWLAAFPGPADPSAAEEGMAPALRVQLVGPGWDAKGHIVAAAVDGSMIAALYQLVRAMGQNVPHALTTAAGEAMALLRVRVLRWYKGGLGGEPMWWSVAPCRASGAWIEGMQSFCVNVPESWLIRRGDPGNDADKRACVDAVMAVCVEATRVLEGELASERGAV